MSDVSNVTRESVKGLTIGMKDKNKLDEYVLKFQDKFFKIYKKLNVKVASKEVLKEELDPSQSLINILASIGGHLNKVSNQLTQFLKQNDNEIQIYKNIIQNKLRPQLQKLMEENTKFRSDLKKEQDGNNSKMRDELKIEKEIEKVVSQMKGEKKFLEDRIKTMQKQLDRYIDLAFK